MRKQRAFTLVELLVVIGIIAVLIGILLPALGSARESANAMKCAANLRTIGQGIAIYLAENKQTYPPAYIYEGMQINGGVQTPDAAVNGYVHWSSYIYGNKDRARNGQAFTSTEGWAAFQCPTIEKGGLPPTNTFAGNLDDGQHNDNGASIVDKQAPRLAYTVNEAIMPRNKFVIGFQGSTRRYQFVRQLKNAAGTILATEFNQDWHIVADAGRSNPDETVCKSHRPVHGFIDIGGSQPDISAVAADSFGRRPTYRKCTINDLSGTVQVGGALKSRLDWVGRNHGKRKVDAQGFDIRKTNFLYCDGHVETKNIKETLSPFQWGERFYSISPNIDMATN
jgi:prepilin-type N-terminal cleavage/methylation domain-containing protein/prepilin-type processing-associated H-X9-DG protein